MNIAGEIGNLIEQLTVASKKMATAKCEEPMSSAICQHPKLLLKMILEATLSNINSGLIAPHFIKIAKKFDQLVQLKFADTKKAEEKKDEFGFDAVEKTLKD